jgi:hypothetical protein
MGILQNVRSPAALPPSVHRVTKEGLPTNAQAEHDARVHEYFNRTSVLLQESGGISATALGLIPGNTEYGQADFDAAIGEALAANVRTIYLPGRLSGGILLGEPITINDSVVFQGENKSLSVFVMKHTGTGLIFTGANGNGGGLRNLSVSNGSDANCTAYVQCIATSDGISDGSSPDFFSIEDCNFTTAGTVYSAAYGIIFDGNARIPVDPALHLAGIRNTRIVNTDIFSCTAYNVSLRQARLCYLHNVSNNGGNAGLNLGIEITGVSGAPSEGVFMTGCNVGKLDLNFAIGVRGDANAIADASRTTNTSSSRVGYVTGTVTGTSATTYFERLDGTIV